MSIRVFPTPLSLFVILDVSVLLLVVAAMCPTPVPFVTHASRPSRRLSGRKRYQAPREHGGGEEHEADSDATQEVNPRGEKAMKSVAFRAMCMVRAYSSVVVSDHSAQPRRLKFAPSERGKVHRAITACILLVRLQGTGDILSDERDPVPAAPAIAGWRWNGDGMGLGLADGAGITRELLEQSLEVLLTWEACWIRFFDVYQYSGIGSLWCCVRPSLEPPSSLGAFPGVPSSLCLLSLVCLSVCLSVSLSACLCLPPSCLLFHSFGHRPRFLLVECLPPVPVCVGSCGPLAS